jgi:hypothetical protein
MDLTTGEIWALWFLLAVAYTALATWLLRKFFKYHDRRMARLRDLDQVSWLTKKLRARQDLRRENIAAHSFPVIFRENRSD